MQVWVSNYKVKSGLESVPSDLKNRLEEIYFQDEATRLRCKGWLVLKSIKHLQADIMFPGCEFDCRFTIRARTGERERSIISNIILRGNT